MACLRGMNHVLVHIIFILVVVSLLPYVTPQATDATTTTVTTNTTVPTTTTVTTNTTRTTVPVTTTRTNATSKPTSNQVKMMTYDEALAAINNMRDVSVVYTIIKTVNQTTLQQLTQTAIVQRWALDAIKRAFLTALGEMLMAKVQVTALSPADLQGFGPSAVFVLPPSSFRYLSNDVISFLLNIVYNETGLAMSALNASQLKNASATTPATTASIQNLLDPQNSLRLSALCQQAFVTYQTAKTINSADGWKNIKFMLFCAPVKACQTVASDLVQKDVQSLAFQPWVCNPQGKEDLKKFTEMFPGNMACGKTLAAILTKGGISSPDDLARLGQLAICVDPSLIKSVVESNCNLAGTALSDNTVSPQMKAYITKKCVTLPTSYNNITCAIIATTYGAFLSSMPVKFFQDLPVNVSCNAECLGLFKKSSLPEDVQSMIMRKCYKMTSNVTAADLTSLGSLVTSLPPDKLRNVNATDLKQSIQTIKEGLGQAGVAETEQAIKSVTLGVISKKMVANGEVSQILDSQQLMKEVSLRDLRSKLANSTNILADLGVANTTKVSMTDSQKKWVVRQVLNKKDASNMTVDDLAAMKSTVTGMLSTSVKKLGDANSNSTGGMDLAKVMCAETGWPKKSLIAINRELIQGSLRVRNESNPLGALTIVDVQSLGCDCLLNFNATEFENMTTEVCSALCLKLGYCDRFRCQNPVSRANTLQACLKCKNLGSQVMTDTDFTELGPNLISQMSTNQLNLAPLDVIKAHLAFFKTMCLNSEMRGAISSLILKLVGSSASQYTSEVLYALGSAIKLLPKTLQEQLDKKILADMTLTVMEEINPTTEEGKYLKSCCNRWLNETDLANLNSITFAFMITLKNAMFSQPPLTRRKRSDFLWTCYMIKAVKALFPFATIDEINIVDKNEVLDCLTDIGELTALSEAQRSALVIKVKQALNQTNVCLMTIENIISMGVLVSAFNESELSCLPFNETSLLVTLGSIKDWTPAEATLLATHYMSSHQWTSLTNVTSYDISVLGSIMCGFSVANIGTIPSAEVGKSGADIGDLSMCSVDVMNALKNRAVQSDAYGPVSSWTAADVSELKYVIAGLNDSEVQSLNLTALEGLSPEVIPAIPDYVFKMFTVDQLKSFTDSQAVSVTAVQKNALSAEQRSVLKSTAVAGETVMSEVNIQTGVPSTGSVGRLSVIPIMLLTWTVWVM